ncbi:MAG: tRNA guanosine(34) transglycosylase Tgt [Defluviitaleaceae bacterium]|nr:tRNA guanosine(34) transglycosylase Tgt [Defluviitaleaceae bacterium]
MYRIIAEDGRAKRAELVTPDGTVETPVFMNVATCAAIKGALTPLDLREAGCQIALCNAYHLHVRPGEEIIESFGGIKKFMAWDSPVLTDSGGYQIHSLSKLRKIKEEGVYFNSHTDGRKIFMGPEESAEIQYKLGSTIAMAFDECPPHDAEREYVLESAKRTTRWLKRFVKRHSEIRKDEKKQFVFGICQGGTYGGIRAEHAGEIAETELDGYAVGGLAVGEPADKMYRAVEEALTLLPRNKPTYLMGVGTPENILEAVERGVDFFDCVLPARNGRHGNAYTSRGKLNLLNAKHERDERPLDEACGCYACENFSRAYIRHLFKAGEMLAMRLCVMHNLRFYNGMTAEIRKAISEGRYAAYKRDVLDKFGADY